MKFLITKTAHIAPREVDTKGEENEGFEIISEWYYEGTKKGVELIVKLNRLEDPNSIYEYKLVK